MPDLSHEVQEVVGEGSALAARVVISGTLRGEFAGVSADGPRRLWIRSLESPEVRPLAGTDGATEPFWSPDGTRITENLDFDCLALFDHLDRLVEHALESDRTAPRVDLFQHDHPGLADDSRAAAVDRHGARLPLAARPLGGPDARGSRDDL